MKCEQSRRGSEFAQYSFQVLSDVKGGESSDKIRTAGLAVSLLNNRNSLGNEGRHEMYFCIQVQSIELESKYHSRMPIISNM